MYFVLVFFLLVYTSFSLFGIPSLSVVFFIPLIFFKWRKNLETRDISFIILMTLFFIASVLCTPALSESSFYVEKTKALIQILISLFAFVIFLRIDRSINLEKACLIIVVFLCIGSLLEIIGIIKPLSDLVRSKAFVETLYTADSRDLVFAGHIRPKLFTAEPSHVSKAFFAFCHAWLLFNPTKKKFLVALALHIYMGWAQASPIILISLLCLPIAWFAYYKSFLAKAFVFISFISLVTIAITYRSEFQQIANIYSRLERGVSGNADGSFHQRFFNPLISAGDVLSHNPIFGIGIGNKEYILEFSSLAYLGDAGLIVGNNGLFKYIIYYGIFGVLFLLFLFKRYLEDFFSRKNLLLFAVYFFAYNLMTSSVVTPRYWLFLALLVVSLSRSRSNFHVQEG